MSTSSSSTLNIIGISGSLSADAATARLLAVALDGARSEGAVTTMIDLREWDLPFCDGRDDVDSYPARVQELRQLVRSSHGILLASPEYHNSLSGVLKNALDLLSSEEMSGKICGLIGVAGGGHGAINALNALRLICRGVGAWVVPQQVSISHSGNAFDGAGRLHEGAIAHRLHHLGALVATNARLHFSIPSKS